MTHTELCIAGYVLIKKKKRGVHPKPKLYKFLKRMNNSLNYPTIFEVLADAFSAEVRLVDGYVILHPGATR